MDIVFQQRAQEIADEVVQLLIQKNHDYGDSFSKLYQEYGDISTAIRLSDKIERFKKLITTEQKVKDESIDDTLKDLIGYSILALIEREKNGR